MHGAKKIKEKIKWGRGWNMIVARTGLPSKWLWGKSLKEIREEAMKVRSGKALQAERHYKCKLISWLRHQSTHPPIQTSHLSLQPAVPSAYNALPPSICLGALWPLAAFSALLQFSWYAQDRTWHGANCRQCIYKRWNMEEWNHSLIK